MANMTRIYAFKSLDQAASAAGYWKAQSFHVAVAGPTDAIRLSNSEDDAILWDSGESADWYLVVASKASLEVIAAESA